MMFHPNLLPPTADPQDSIRYDNVTLCHEMIECKFDTVTFYNDIDKTNMFFIEDKSPRYNGYTCHKFQGTVIKEPNGTYNWWRNIKQ